MSQTIRLECFSETTLQLGLTVTVDQINNYFREKEGGLQTAYFQDCSEQNDAYGCKFLSKWEMYLRFQKYGYMRTAPHDCYTQSNKSRDSPATVNQRGTFYTVARQIRL